MLLLLASEAEKILVLGLLLVVILGVPTVTIIVHMRNKLNRQGVVLRKRRRADIADYNDTTRQINETKKSVTLLPLVTILLAVCAMVTCHTINESERSTYRNAQVHWVSGNGARDGLCADVGGRATCGLGEGGFKFGLFLFLAAGVFLAIPLARLKQSNEKVRAEIVAEKIARKKSTRVISDKYQREMPPGESN
jgi:hypothetical protein